MRRTCTALLLAPALAVACTANPDKRTLAALRYVEPDVTEVRVEGGLARAILGYRKFLEEAPVSALTPEAMRRLADLKLEKEYGIVGEGDLVELPAPTLALPSAGEVSVADAGRLDSPPAAISDDLESESAFERRATGADEILPHDRVDLALPDTHPGGQAASTQGPREAIELYDQILATYPDYEHNDRVLYQKARALDELGQPNEAIAVIERLVREFPHSRTIDEVQFRRAEYYFMRKQYLDAEEAYTAIAKMGAGSDYYELALYKLGWTLYKQQFHEEALDQYIALLDYKVSIGYDFAQTQDESDKRRIADTFRVISLSFSSDSRR